VGIGLRGGGIIRAALGRQIIDLQPTAAKFSPARRVRVREPLRT